MKLAIMQPYFLPSIYYWQMLNNVDKFIILDDVSFMPKKFIHRNFIIHNNKKIQLTVTLKKKSLNRLINQHEILNISNFYKIINFVYKNEKNYNDIIYLIDRSFFGEKNLSKAITNLLANISSYLGIKTEFIFSSSIMGFKKKGEEQLIQICNHFKAKSYINLSGGKNIYNKSNFLENNISLQFVNNGKYPQDISIIDYLMKKDKAELMKIINDINLTK